MTDSSTKPFFIIPTANGDHVICFACGIGVKNWNCECDPWEEHLRYKPKCPFLRVGHNAYKQEKKVRKISSYHRNASHVYSEYTYFGSLYHRSKNSLICKWWYSSSLYIKILYRGGIILYHHLYIKDFIDRHSETCGYIYIKSNIFHHLHIFWNV